MIKSHVLYRLSYALTLSLGMIREAGCRVPKGIRGIMQRPALCRGQTAAGQ